MDRDDQHGGQRRRALLAIAAGGCAVAAAAGAPTIIAVVAPARSAGGDGARYVVGKLDDLAIGVPRKVAIIGDEIDGWTRAPKRKLGAVWLHRRGERDVQAFSVTCPHLGCAIDVAIDGAGKASGYECPCHDSSFGLDGARGSGPSPRGMDPLPVDIAPDGAVSVIFKRFRIGTREREELG
ncbi:MAG: Rieske (2Fe-2S) protein [Deltaproteobacteria bacterium]|nr:Rieske (2Fe-2S) protein [Deltaproteobacteria bacterium]